MEAHKETAGEGTRVIKTYCEGRGEKFKMIVWGVEEVA